MKESISWCVHQVQHVDIEPNNSIEVLANLEANDVETSLGEKFTTPYVAYQLGLEDGWWCDPYSYWFALNFGLCPYSPC